MAPNTEEVLATAVRLLPRIDTQDRYDFVHDAYLRVFGSGVTPFFANKDDAAAYIAQAVRHLAIDQARREQCFEEKINDVAAVYSGSPYPAPDDSAIVKEILAFLDGIDPKRRMTFMLRVLDDQSFAAIGSELGYTRTSNQPGIFFRDVVERLRDRFGPQSTRRSPRWPRERAALLRGAPIAVQVMG